MIAATSDLGYKTWDNGAITRTGATGAAIGTGLANTNAIISQLGAAGSYNYAAGVSANYSVNDGRVTYYDWFLPSRDELYKLYINKAEIGGFTGTYYLLVHTIGVLRSLVAPLLFRRLYTMVVNLTSLRTRVDRCVQSGLFLQPHKLEIDGVRYLLCVVSIFRQ